MTPAEMIHTIHGPAARGHQPPAAPTGAPDRYDTTPDKGDALRWGLASIIGWYKGDGQVPVEALQRLAADPVAADRALRFGETDPLTVLRQAVQLPILAEPDGGKS